MTQQEIQPFTLDEARAFLAAAASHRLNARWVVGLSLGLRQGEALGLQWSDVNLDTGVLHVQRSLRRQPNGSLALAPPKTTRSERSLPMPEPLVAALQAHFEQQKSERAALVESWEDQNFVFTTAVGTPIHPRNDYRAFQALLQRAQLRKVRLHDLRHTAASLLLAQGVPSRVVMEILGHSQISVTLNTYSHVDTTLTQEAAARMKEALWPGDE